MKSAFWNIVGIVTASILLGASCPPSDVSDDNPFVLETKDASDVSYDSATLNAYSDLTGIRFQSLTYGFLWGTSATSMDKDIGCVDAASTITFPKLSFSAQLKDLKPKTKYWYKAYVKLGNHVFYGDIKSFSTGEFMITAVDLGLSVKWANVNLGAAMPEDYGDYYAWGETKPKTYYSWETYKWSKGDYNKLTKYCTDFHFWDGTGLPDDKTVLDPDDDAARVILGSGWRIPTYEEWGELLDESNCKWEWSSKNGIEGYLVTSKKNGNSIFLPAAGYRYDTYLYDVGSRGDYWSSSLDTDDPYAAWFVYFKSCDVLRGSCSRYCGQSVRPVSE